jgi:hypothetical protein
MNTSFFASEETMVQSSSPVGGIVGMLILILSTLVLVAIIILIARARRKGNKREANVAGFGAPMPGRDQQGGAVGAYVKRCPTCQSTFTDETLAFCLSDGSTLERVANTTSNDPYATLVYPEANRSEIAPTVQYHPDTSPNKKG